MISACSLSFFLFLFLSFFHSFTPFIFLYITVFILIQSILPSFTSFLHCPSVSASFMFILPTFLPSYLVSTSCYPSHTSHFLPPYNPSCLNLTHISFTLTPTATSAIFTCVLPAFITPSTYCSSHLHHSFSLHFLV